MREFKLSFLFYLKSLRQRLVSFLIFFAFNIFSLVYLFNGEPTKALKIFFMFFPFMVLSMGIDIINSEFNNKFMENLLFVKKMNIKKMFLFKNFFPFLVSLPFFLIVLTIASIVNYPIKEEIFIFLSLSVYYSFLATLISYKVKGMSNFLVVLLGIIFYQGYIAFIIGFDKFHSLTGVNKTITNLFLVLTYPSFIERKLYFIPLYLFFCIITYYIQVKIWKKKKI